MVELRGFSIHSPNYQLAVTDIDRAHSMRSIHGSFFQGIYGSAVIFGPVMIELFTTAATSVQGICTKLQTSQKLAFTVLQLVSIVDCQRAAATAWHRAHSV